MRRLAMLLLGLAACHEPAAIREPPMDRFLHPNAMAVTAPANGGALLVVSSNFDLQYSAEIGGTVLSVDPGLAPDGSARAGGGALVKRGAGVQFGSFSGQLAVADATTCTGFTGVDGRPLALVPSRLDDTLNVLPIETNGSLGACTGGACQVGFELQLHDPWSATLACRSDGTRRSLYVGFRSVADRIGYPAGIGWLEEFDVDELGLVDSQGLPIATGRALQVSASPIADATYDPVADRLVAVGRPTVLTAPLTVIDLPPCRVDPSPTFGQPPDGSCPVPVFHATDLNKQLPGIDLQAVALSNPQVGLPRRAYLAARLYDANIAALIGVRPPDQDIAGALLVVDLEDNAQGAPAMTILQVVPLGLGASQVRVLPVRAAHLDGSPRRDLVVVTSSTEGVVSVYDDDEELVARAIHLESETGAPQAGRRPYALAVGPVTAGVVRVYVAAFDQSVVSLLDVPLLSPGQAYLLRGGTVADPTDHTQGQLLRIGGQL
jgi:hypothetical protein